jgi:hypothetical protein
MRTCAYLFVCLLCFVPRAARSQLTARDTAALVEAVAAQIHLRFGTGVRREPFAIVARDTRASEDLRFVARVIAAINTRDSTLIITVPVRSTMRLHLGAPALVGDTVKVSLYRFACSGGTSPIHTFNNASLDFRRAGSGWAIIERYSGSGGAGPGCPW